MYEGGFKTTIAEIKDNYFKNSDLKIKSVSKALVLAKTDMLKALLNLYNIFKYPKYESDADELRKYIPELADTVNDIMTAKNQLECYDVFKKFYDNTLIPMSTDMFLNGISDYKTSPYTSHCCCPYPQNYTGIFNNITTTRKSLNVFYDTLASSPVRKDTHTDIRESWKHERCQLRSYCFAPNIDYMSDTSVRNANDFADKFLFGSASDCRFSTDFDIGVIDFVNSQFFSKDYDNSFNLCPKNEFYRVNTHISCGSPLIASIASQCVDYNFLEFLSMYLINIDVYVDTVHNVTAFVGMTTRKRTESPDILFKLISKLINRFEPEFTYHISGEENDDIIFRSTYLSAETALNVINNNGDRLKIVNDNVYKVLSENVTEDDRHPLIPFNPGQLGLVLVSGDIDGIVDEGNGRCHAIKGSTTRIMEMTESEDEDTMCKLNTTITKVTALLPDGTILNLR